MRRFLLPAMLALTCAAVAVARDLPVPADSGWMHAETKLVLHVRLAGLRRTRMIDATSNERDVAVSFEDGDGSVVATIFLFHPAVASVPLWFDRSLAAIAERNQFEHAAPASADPIAFAPTGGAVPTALRQSFSVLRSPYRSTGVAVLPFGDWLVAVRASAKTLTADQFDALLLKILSELKLPADAAAPVAVPIKPCAEMPAYTKAKLIKADPSDMLLSLLGGTAAARAKATTTPVTWCRAGEGRAMFGVYRNVSGAKGYMLGLGDSGRVAGVWPGLTALTGHGDTYSVTMTDLDDVTVSFPSFASLPEPEQVFNLVMKTPPTGSAYGTVIRLTPGGLE